MVSSACSLFGEISKLKKRLKRKGSQVLVKRRAVKGHLELLLWPCHRTQRQQELDIQCSSVLPHLNTSGGTIKSRELLTPMLRRLTSIPCLPFSMDNLASHQILRFGRKYQSFEDSSPLNDDCERSDLLRILQEYAGY